MIHGVIFDLDGTLFEADYDWKAIKRRLGVPSPDGSIIEYLESLPQGEQKRKEQLLEEIEDRATREGRLKPGAVELLDFLHERGLITALVTNNRRENAERVLARYGLEFDLVLTRESGLTKPSGAPLLLATERLNLKPGDLAAVGDNEFDLRAAHEAGLGLIIIVNPDVDRFKGRCDYAVRDLEELKDLLGRLLQRQGEEVRP